MNKIKIIIFFSFLSIILTGIGWTHAQTSTLEINYPILSRAPDPSLLSYLPDYIRYIYIFVVSIGGIIALVILTVAGFRYLTSAGNPSTMSDSRNQILSAFIGLIVLLGSFVFLNQLDPQTLTIEPPHLLAAGQGIILYSDDNCGDNSDALPNIVKPLPSGTKFLRIETTSRIGEENFGTDAFSVGSFYTFNSQEDFTIEFYGNKDCENDWIETVPNDTLQTFGERTCISNNLWGARIDQVKCVKMLWHKPGIYVYSFPNSTHSQHGNPEERVPPGECFKIYQNSVGGLPDCLNDKVGSIALVDDEKNQVKYGVVLRRNPRAIFGNDNAGWAHVYMPYHNPDEEITLHDTEWQDVSSLTVFQINEDSIEAPVKVCRNAACEKQAEYPAAITFNWDGSWEREEPEGTSPNPSTGSAGLEEIVNISSAMGYTTPIAKGIRFIRDSNGDFDGRWWAKGGLTFRNIRDGHGHSTLRPSGVSAINFPRPGTRYLAILYDRANATTAKLSTDGVLWPGKEALVFGTSKPDLAQVKFDGCSGSLLLIKAKIQ
ncbi:MAG: pilin [Patescibacteria group bacterium]|nr:pilin [Patescibacteria group bacterium]